MTIFGEESVVFLKNFYVQNKKKLAENDNRQNKIFIKLVVEQAMNMEIKASLQAFAQKILGGL